MICVDASVVAKWILVEERTDQALALYDTTLRAGESIVAPPLLPSEITNIIRKRMRSPNPISRERAIELLEQFLGLSIELRNPPGLHRRALELADDFGLPAVYDAHYLALAEALGCALWTDDHRLQRAVGHRLPLVRLVGEYSATG